MKHPTPQHPIYGAGIGRNTHASHPFSDHSKPLFVQGGGINTPRDLRWTQTARQSAPFSRTRISEYARNNGHNVEEVNVEQTAQSGMKNGPLLPLASQPLPLRSSYPSSFCVKPSQKRDWSVTKSHAGQGGPRRQNLQNKVSPHISPAILGTYLAGPDGPTYMSAQTTSVIICSDCSDMLLAPLYVLYYYKVPMFLYIGLDHLVRYGKYTVIVDFSRRPNLQNVVRPGTFESLYFGHLKCNRPRHCVPSVGVYSRPNLIELSLSPALTTPFHTVIKNMNPGDPMKPQPGATMKTIETADLSSLDGASLEAAKRIVDRIAAIEPDLNLGGVSFLSGEEWRNRGEKYGETAVLVLIHEGERPFAKYFSYDACYEVANAGRYCTAEGANVYRACDEMAGHLRSAGFLPEQMYRWATSVHPA